MPLLPARVLPPNQCNVNSGLHGSIGKGGLERGQCWAIKWRLTSRVNWS